VIAIDTNVLVGAIQTFDPAVRADARRAVKVLHRQAEQLVCFPQNPSYKTSRVLERCDAAGSG